MLKKPKYPELQHKCKTCYLKCGRVENPEFIGVYRCEYYTEEGNNENNNTNIVQKQKK